MYYNKWNKRCDLCENSLIQGSNFQSSATGRHYSIRLNLSCSSRNVIYLATCNKCNLQYVSSSSTEFKVRFRKHKSTMLNNKRTCELAVHFNSLWHDISQINFILIEQITKFKNSIHLDKLLLTREASWTAQLFTLNSHGLNKDVNFVENTESITTVCFTTQLLVGLSLSIYSYSLLHWVCYNGFRILLWRLSLWSFRGPWWGVCYLLAIVSPFLYYC